MPPTMAEREAELAALQSAFDEYIASSRELEEELDAELAKMRKFCSNDQDVADHCRCAANALEVSLRRTTIVIVAHPISVFQALP
jgi:hypothetical protein